MKRNRRATIARVAAMTALAVLVGAGFQSSRDLFQKALQMERTEGNIKEAIALFEKVVTQAGEDEALAAQAQLRIGFCYEKLGMQEAEKAFKLVIEKYPSQAEAVRQARERLERFAAGATSPAPAAGLTLKKLDIPEGIPSPDGKYISSNDGEDDLFLYDIATGKKQILKKSGKSGFLFTNVLWAPDSSRFAYVWSNDREAQSLFVWALAENKETRIFDGSGINDLNPVGWSTDLKEIYVQIQKNKAKSLAHVSVKTGALSEILADDKTVDNMSLSPDGKYIAYNYNTNAKDQDIRTITVDGKIQTVLFKCQGLDRFLGWSPHGDYVLFSSNRTGSACFWLQGVREGKPEGESKIVNPIGGDIYYARMTKQGSLYYGIFKSASDAFTAKIDLQTGKTIQSPQKIESSTVGRTSTPLWSADGNRLGYFFRKNAATNLFTYDTFKFLDQKTGETKEIPLDFDAQPDYMQLPRWTKDGKIIHMRGTISGKTGLLRFDIETGRSEILADDAGISAWSTDGSIIFIMDRGPRPIKLTERQSKLIRKDLQSGEKKVLYQGAVGEMMSWVKLSPDESFVGILSDHFGEAGNTNLGVRIIASNSEAALTKDNTLAFPGSAMYNWTHDGKGLILSIASENNSASKLFYYPKVDPNSSPIPLELGIKSANFAFHPDGKTIAYTGQSVVEEFWVMENFLPKR